MNKVGYFHLLVLLTVVSAKFLISDYLLNHPQVFNFVSLNVVAGQWVQRDSWLKTCVLLLEMGLLCTPPKKT